MRIDTIDIRDIIPQRAPLLLVDCLLTYDDVASEATLLVRRDNPFVEETLSVAGLVEHVAQACAARIGYYNKFVLHRDISIGYVGAIRNFVVHRQPGVGEVLQTRIEVLSSAFGLSLVHATVRTAHGEMVAEGEMKIAES